jgi:hypothetical protein
MINSNASSAKIHKRGWSMKFLYLFHTAIEMMLKNMKAIPDFGTKYQKPDIILVSS